MLFLSGRPCVQQNKMMRPDFGMNMYNPQQYLPAHPYHLAQFPNGSHPGYVRDHFPHLTVFYVTVSGIRCPPRMVLVPTYVRLLQDVWST